MQLQPVEKLGAELRQLSAANLESAVLVVIPVCGIRF